MRSPGKGGETKNPKYGRKTPARASVSETDKKFNLIKTITTMKYLIRSVKYFIALCVLYLIIMALMLLTNTSVLTPSETFSALVHSTRGQVLIVAVVLLSALYPKFGFIRRQEIGSLRKNREQILNAFVSEGFKPVRESEHEMVFRADSLFKRLTLLFEDEIRVTQTGEWITIEGIRRGVARVYYRLQSYLERTRNENESATSHTSPRGDSCGPRPALHALLVRQAQRFRAGPKHGSTGQYDAGAFALLRR